MKHVAQHRLGHKMLRPSRIPPWKQSLRFTFVLLIKPHYFLLVFILNVKANIVLQTANWLETSLQLSSSLYRSLWDHPAWLQRTLLQSSSTMVKKWLLLIVGKAQH